MPIKKLQLKRLGNLLSQESSSGVPNLTWDKEEEVTQPIAFTATPDGVVEQVQEWDDDWKAEYTGLTTAQIEELREERKQEERAERYRKAKLEWELKYGKEPPK